MNEGEPRVVVDQAGNRVGVLLDVDEYERLVKASEMLESLRSREEDKGIRFGLYPRREKTDGRPARVSGLSLTGISSSTLHRPPPGGAIARLPWSNPDTIVVVSGLPRSGTSMMMQMLEAGGMDVLTDGRRTADEDNLKGYYEYEKVKALKTDNSWLPRAGGKAVKIISELLRHLPGTHTYRVIFMRRAMEEILASQDRMLIRRGVAPGVQADHGEIARIFPEASSADGNLAFRAVLSFIPSIRTIDRSWRILLARPPGSTPF